MNPTRAEVIEALKTTTHHMLITGHHYEHLMSKNGWILNNVGRLNLGPDQYHYVNHGRTIDNWEELWGFYHWEEFYERIAQWIPTDGAMLEIGNFHGKSLAHFATMIKEMGKNTDCYGIDTYGSINNCAMLASTYMRSIRNVKAMGLESNMHLIPGYSSEICNWFQPESLDFIYIDACHGYRSVVRDIKVSLPLLKKGGIISGHDYVSPMFDGVIQAVNEAFGAKNVQVHKGNVWEYVPPN